MRTEEFNHIILPMRSNLIKRFFIGLLLIVVASISANAQEGLYVKRIFQRFGHAKGCKMVSGYYMMAPLSNGDNRFILFSNPSESKGTVIYIEGDLSPEDIMKLCYSRR